MSSAIVLKYKNKKRHRYLFFIGIGLVLASIVFLFGFWNKAVVSHVLSDAKSGYVMYFDKPLDKPVSALPSIGLSPSVPSELQTNFNIKLPILVYHYVEHVKDKNDILRQRMNVNPEELAAVIMALKDANYSFLWVQDVPILLANQNTIPPNAVILTFDDGYEDFYTDVFPILRFYGVKATLYIVNNFIDRPGYLTTSQLQEIAASGLVEFGAHTLDHFDLKGQPIAKIKSQIEESKLDLQRRFGVEVKTFAYPYGHFDETVVNAVRDANFAAAVSTLDGWWLSAKNLFVLPRLHAGQFTGQNVVFKLAHLR